MTHAAPNFPLRYSLDSRSADVWRAPRHAYDSAFLTFGALLFAGMLAIAPPAFAQHGGGGGGGGGSHGGGFGGGGGGGSHSGGSGGGSRSGSRSGSSNRSASRGSTVGPQSVVRPGSAGYTGERRGNGDVITGLTGVGGAFRRFFGYSHPSTNSASIATPDSSVALINRAAAQASLPLALSRVRIGQSSSPTSDSRVSDALHRPPPRPIGPSPSQPPIAYGGYGGFYQDLATGLGFPSPSAISVISTGSAQALPTGATRGILKRQPSCCFT